MTLSTGDRFGAYEILGVIGAGGMGVVYRALDTRLKREVALKLLPDVADGDDSARARLLHEARSAAALNHPNICTIHEVGDVNGVPYIAMELIGGETLQSQLRRRPMSSDRVCRIGKQLADALEHAHTHGIIHRDFKSANVMITPEGRPKVLDFGIASQLRPPDEPTRTVTAIDPNGRTAGTLAYMAPEVLQGHGADARSDVWALGIVLHEMLSGRVPFERQTDSDLAAAILRDAPAPLPSGTPPALARIVERCLVKEPTERPARSGEVSLALDVASPQSMSIDGDRLRGRLAVAVVSLVVIGIAWWALRSRSAGPAQSESVIRLANPVQVTTSVGVEEFAAWSPDGRTLAYAAHTSGLSTDGNWDIWITQVGGGAPINRTADHPGRDQFPSWSPDGTQIAFWSDRDGGGCFVMPALSGPPRKVATSGLLDPNAPQWSEDGSALTCVVGTVDEVFANTVSLNNSAAETRLLLPGATRRMFVNRSRDGRVYAAVAAAGGLDSDVSQLWLLHVPSNRSVAVTDGTTRVWSPSWSPDGHWLYYVSNAAGGMDLWRRQVSDNGELTGPPQGITVGVGMRNAAISRDGTRVAYSQGRRIANVWRAPIMPDKPITWADATQITVDQAFIEFVDVSPSGKRLAVSSDRSGNQDLWTLPSEGGPMQQVTTDRTPEWAPRWSPDESTLAFYAYRTGNRDIFTMPATGGPWTQITSDPGPDLLPSWSRDGKRIVSLAGRPGSAAILISPATGGTGTIVFRVRNPDPQFCPVDDRIAFSAGGSVWMFPALPTGPPVEIAKGLVSALRWMPDGKRLVFVGMRGGERLVASVDVDGSHERILANLSGRRGSIGNLATDGKYLYFTWDEDIGDLWVMDVVEAGK